MSRSTKEAKPVVFGIAAGLVLSIFCTQALAFTLPDPRKPGKYLAVNTMYQFTGDKACVIAGTKAPTAAIIINGKVAVPPNKYTTWYYEYSPAETSLAVVSIPLLKTYPREFGLIKLNGGGIRKLDASGPAIIGIRLDSATKDIILAIKDPSGVLSYNVYYANSLTSAPGITPFIVAQKDVPVSGTGTTTWRDNGTKTGSHPSKVPMRFYKLEVNRSDASAIEIIIASPQDGEVIVE